MKKITGLFLLFLSSLFLFSCVDEHPEIKSVDTLSIEFGTECGWCAGTEYLEVTE